MSPASPPVVCIVGRKNAGKTSLTVELAAELNRRGRRVMTVKHGHGFQVDQPGRDSWRHRHEGGAVRTVLAGPRDFAVIGNWPGEELPLSELVRRFLADGEIILAEGFKGTPEPKIEIFRGAGSPGPLFDPEDPSSPPILAVVTDRRDFSTSVPLFLLDDPGYVQRLVDLLEEELLGKDEAPPGEEEYLPRKGDGP